jgi:hypothetical protein
MPDDRPHIPFKGIFGSISRAVVIEYNKGTLVSGERQVSGTFQRYETRASADKTRLCSASFKASFGVLRHDDDGLGGI